MVRTEFSSEEVLDVLLRQGVLDEEAAADARVREPAQRARLLKQRLGAPVDRAERFRISAPEVIASLQIRRVDGGVLGEDTIMQLVAEALSLPWRRLDPLELDMQLVTSALSRPFATRHACLVVGEVEGELEGDPEQCGPRQSGAPLYSGQIAAGTAPAAADSGRQLAGISGSLPASAGSLSASVLFTKYGSHTWL